MPWKESSVMDERLRFIARLLEGETMTDLCVEFGISYKTGYKIYDRYKESGSEALSYRSRRPRSAAPGHRPPVSGHAVQRCPSSHASRLFASSSRSSLGCMIVPGITCAVPVSPARRIAP